MKKEPFFIIHAQRKGENSAEFDVEICANHSIFAGHFPGDPITPGVCILQIVCDLFSQLKQQKFFITAVKNAKFMQVIRPLEIPRVTFQLFYQPTENQNNNEIKCTIFNQNITFAKMTLTLQAQ